MAERLRVMAGRALGLTAAVLLAVATTARADETDRPPPRTTAKMLDALARQYRDAGLPLPPADAPLLLIQSGVIAAPGRTTNQTTRVVGFKLPLAQDGNGADQFLMGTQIGNPMQTDMRVPAIRPFDAAKGLSTTVLLEEHWENSPEVFPVNNWLALAIQCHLRGYDRLAAQIFARGLATDGPFVPRLTPVGDGNARDSLAATAWNHWMNVQCADGAPRREILARLEKLSAAFPALDGPVQRDYLASLRLAMVPGQGAPDSVERLVDDLVDHAGFGGASSSDAGDPGFIRLRHLGFQAVPALLAHLDDRRLTRSVLVRSDAVRFTPRRVGEVASDLLEEIAGPEEFPRDPSGPPERQQPIDQETAGRWWVKAGAMGEEAYMTGHVFPPSEVSLDIVADRYPQRLGEMYARILKERPEVDCQAILAAIVGCGQIAREEQRRLLHLGVASPDLKCSFEAIGALCEFDRADADAALIEKLDHWPADLTGPYTAGRSEAYIGNFIITADSPEVWQAFERALFRASPSFRMEMLKWVAGNGLRGTSQDVRMLALLDLFLDDEDVRVIRPEDEAEGGRFAGYTLKADDRRISVRNFVAELLGAVLTMKPPPGTVHNERWWAKYRADARAAIDRRAREAAQAPMSETL